MSRYHDAGYTLQKVATHERRLRQRKLALSMAKLSLLMVPPSQGVTTEVQDVDIGLAAANAQYQFSEDILGPIVENCIDNQAKVEVALDVLYLARNLKKSHLRTRVVKRALETLVEERVVDAESLIDLFTLKKRGSGPSVENEFETYFWALQVLRASDVPLSILFDLQQLSQVRKEVALKLIWLRAYLQDEYYIFISLANS